MPMGRRPMNQKRTPPADAEGVGKHASHAGWGMRIRLALEVPA